VVLPVGQRVRVKLAGSLQLIFFVCDLPFSIAVQLVLLNCVVPMLVKNLVVLQGVKTVHCQRSLEGGAVLAIAGAMKGFSNLLQLFLAC
jgi:hypothetical protein